MSNRECIICSRVPEQDEHFIETDDGFICSECMLDLKEIRKDHFGYEDQDKN